jgi:fluoride exporter
MPVGRGSSGVDQLIRNQQVVGSNPILGSLSHMNIYKVLLVGLGGMLGSIARYVTVRSVDARLNAAIPCGTLIVNIAGSFILGLLYAWTSKKTGASEPLQLLLGTGFCGGFTTFSAFALENANLWQSKMMASSIAYIVATLVVGFLSVLAGLALGKAMP